MTADHVTDERVTQLFNLADEIIRAPSRFTKDFVVMELGQAVAELAGAVERARADVRVVTATDAAGRIRAFLDALDSVVANLGFDGEIVALPPTHDAPYLSATDVRQLLDEHAAAVARVAELEARPMRLVPNPNGDLTPEQFRELQEKFTAAMADPTARYVLLPFDAWAESACPCGCVPGQPCGCRLEDCECVDQFTSGCTVCDRPEGA